MQIKAHFITLVSFLVVFLVAVVIMKYLFSINSPLVFGIVGIVAVVVSPKAKIIDTQSGKKMIITNDLFSLFKHKSSSKK